MLFFIITAGRTGDESSSNSELSSSNDDEEKKDEDGDNTQTSDSNESGFVAEKHQNEVFHSFLCLLNEVLFSISFHWFENLRSYRILLQDAKPEFSAVDPNGYNIQPVIFFNME